VILWIIGESFIKHSTRVEILIRLCHSSGDTVLHFLPRKPGFYPKAVHIRFVTNDVGGTGLLPSTSVLHLSVLIPPVHHIRLIHALSGLVCKICQLEAAVPFLSQ
jgi:hypothetical protein